MPAPLSRSNFAFHYGLRRLATMPIVKSGIMKEKKSGGNVIKGFILLFQCIHFGVASRHSAGVMQAVVATCPLCPKLQPIRALVRADSRGVGICFGQGAQPDCVSIFSGKTNESDYLILVLLPSKTSPAFVLLWASFINFKH